MVRWHQISSRDMSSTDLQKAVESSLAAAAGATPGSARLQALARELLAHPELAIFNEKMQLQGRGWSRATYEGLAFWLVGRAANVGEAQATADLVRYLNATEVPHRHILVFGGVIV